jgi:hypothetical protein
VDSSRTEWLETLNKALFPPESPKLRVSPSFMKTLMRDASALLLFQGWIRPKAAITLGWRVVQ